VSVSPRLVLLALLLLVVPAAVTALLLAGGGRRPVRDGAQPGGTLRGRLVAGAGSPDADALGGVRVEVVAIAPDGSALPLASASTDPDGRFALELPPALGHYEVRAGAGAWQPAAQPFSLLGGALEGELVVPLLPAARLEVEFARTDGRAVRGGAWTLDGDPGGSWLSAWRRGRVSARGAFQGARLALDGLPPMRAQLVVRLDGGERVDLVLDLAPGPNRHAVSL
jgi:hypothetical protein